MEAAAHAVRRLCAAQATSGFWCDFWLPVGTSDEWVTAYIALALADAAQSARLPAALRGEADRAATAAANWLGPRARGTGGWGYNACVPADADSTAHVISLLVRLGRPVPPEAIDCITRHDAGPDGFRTYAFADADHQWTTPAPDVTAAVLRALADAGAISDAELTQRWGDALASRQEPDGTWTGFWWQSRAYPTSIAIELWTRAGQPPLQHQPSVPPPSDAFDAACGLATACRLADLQRARHILTHLLSQQHRDGGWPSCFSLKVPPSHPERDWAAPPRIAADSRRGFTTATALRALLHAAGFIEPAARIRSVSAPSPSMAGYLENALDRAARAAGLDQPTATSASQCFRTLTAEALDDITTWPAPQLSSLAGGMPLEFSVAAEGRARPALRYTVEVGNVQALRDVRLASARAAITRAAALYGICAPWSRADGAIEAAASLTSGGPQGERSCLWAGVEHVAGTNGSRATVETTLKAYVLLPSHTMDSAIERVLGSSDIPLVPDVAAACVELQRHGSWHQVGLGIRPDGRFGCKLYFELSRWMPNLAQRVLDQLGFPLEIDALRPAIPGLLDERLSVQSRAGIALSVDGRTGAVDTVTTTAAFIQGFLRPCVVADRVDAWLSANGWQPEPHRALFEALGTASERTDARKGPRHTIFTRTLARTGERRATIYLRPSLLAHP